MSIAALTLLALLAAIILSLVSRLNVGLLAIVMAWLIGVHAGGLQPAAVIAGFPVDLFLTLAGVCFLFGVAEDSGTFGVLAHRMMGGGMAAPALMPLTFFASAMVMSAVGPAAIASTAMILPIAAAMGARARIPPMLTALMVANGAAAGNLSPISSLGVIANSRMDHAGLGGHQLEVMMANLLAHALVAVLAWLWFLPRLRAVGTVLGESGAGPANSVQAEAPPLTRPHVVTLFVLAAWIAGLVLVETNIALSAFGAGVILLILRAGRQEAAISAMPWGIILMVCGVATLVALIQSHGGAELFASLIAEIADRDSIYGVIAFVAGLISTYSSTSGVVLPALLPMAPGLAAATGASDPLAIALSINVGASLVDISPLSTLGALCVAALGKHGADPRLYFKLLAWGLAMTVVAAALCQLAAMVLIEHAA